MGVCFHDTQENFFTYNLLQFKGKDIFEKFCDTVHETLGTFYPDLIITATPVLMPGRSNILISQMKKYGALCAIAHRFDKTVLDFKDSHAKKVVLGSGRANKDAIKRFYEGSNITIDSPDVRDARMFLDCYLQTV